MNIDIYLFWSKFLVLYYLSIIIAWHIHGIALFAFRTVSLLFLFSQILFSYWSYSLFWSNSLCYFCYILSIYFYILICGSFNASQLSWSIALDSVKELYQCVSTINVFSMVIQNVHVFINGQWEWRNNGILKKKN